LQWLADSMVGIINRNALRGSPSGRQGLGDFFESTAFGVYAKPMTAAAIINRAARQYPKK
jgi:hypothetical protein